MGYAVGQPNKKSDFYQKHKEGVRYDVFLNFAFYGFRKPDVFCMDVAKNGFRGKRIREEDEVKKVEVKEENEDEKEGRKEEMEEGKKEIEEGMKEKMEEGKMEEKEERKKMGKEGEGKEEGKMEEKEGREEGKVEGKDERREEGKVEVKEEGVTTGNNLDHSNEVLTSFDNKFPANQFFDAIISDPPYGLRAAILGEEERNCDDMVDLLFDLAERLLKKKGRLVYLYPILKEEGLQFSKIKHRKGFELIDVAENFLNSKNGRLCFTYQKL